MDARTAFLIKQEAERVVNRLGITGYPQRCISAVARRILLLAPYLINGRSINPVAKSVGAGVWELRLRKEGE